MSPRGAIPKPPGRRVRNHREPAPQRVLDVEAVPQPELPGDVLPEGETWSPATVRWWETWGASPLTDTWDAVIWHELLVAAMLHHRAMGGSSAAATELRLRVAKLGATPDDRARLRISSAEADRHEQRGASTTGNAARQRYAAVTHLQPAPSLMPGTDHEESHEHRDHDHRAADRSDDGGPHDDDGGGPGAA